MTMQDSKVMMKSGRPALTPTPLLLLHNARSKRRRPQRLEEQKPWTGVRLTELLGGGAHTFAATPNNAMTPALWT